MTTPDMPVDSLGTPDRRRWPFNGRVAAEELRGKVAAETFEQGQWRLVTAPVADLLDDREGRRDRQVLRGERLRVLETDFRYAFVQAEKDGYVGYVEKEALDMYEMHEAGRPNAMISQRSTLAYPGPDMKQPHLARYSMGARLHVIGTDGKWSRTDVGHVPSSHLRMFDQPETDPVEVAERFLCMPYQWGGNGYDGIDCSGLVQAACVACGIACPGDSDMQEAELGSLVPPEESPRRGDLMFWKGHVAWVADDRRILHANAHHMAVVHEGLEDAVARIRAQGDGDVTAVRRLG